MSGVEFSRLDVLPDLEAGPLPAPHANCSIGARITAAPFREPGTRQRSDRALVSIHELGSRFPSADARIEFDW